jgi:hypothetical protein
VTISDAERVDLGDADLADVLDFLRAAYPDHTIYGTNEIIPPPYTPILRLWGVTQTEADSALATYAPTLIPQSYPWRTIYKYGDEGRTSATDPGAPLRDDSDLRLLTVANTSYEIRFRAKYNAVAAAQFKYRMAHTGTTSRVRRFITRGAAGQTPSPSAAISAFDVADVALTGGPGGTGMIYEDISLRVGATGGLLSFPWAQNTPDPSVTFVFEGATLEYMIV